MTLVEMLERNARDYPAKTAIAAASGALTYGALNESVNRLASSFLKAGMRKGNRVAIMLPRVPELIIGFLAAAKAEGIAAPVNFELTPDKISSVLKGISPAFLIIYGPYIQHAAVAMHDVPGMKVIAVKADGGGHLPLERFMAEGSAENPGLKCREDDVVYLNYTSGSTGESKGALTTHANIYWNTAASAEALNLTHEDVHLCMFAPFAHPHELFARGLFLGGTTALVDKVYPKAIAEAIAGHKVTCMMGLAPMYENMLELLEHREYDLSSLRIPESGGMYTRPDLIKRFKERLGVPIVPVWGSTETTGIALANRPGGYMPEGSVGRACPYYEMKIVDEEGVEAGPDVTGEMIFRGPAVVSGYYEETPGSPDNFKDGWYYSNDLAVKDRDGFVYFVERKSGMMKVAGLKVYPSEIERALMEHPDIKEVSVIAVKDNLRGEVPKAIIRTKDMKVLTQRDVLGFCRERLPHYKLPRIIEFRESLPKTGSGKINKKALEMEHA